MSYVKIIFLLISLKGLFFSLTVGVPHFSPQCFDQRVYRANLRWPSEESHPAEKYFKTWDTSHYLYIAEKGYAAGRPSNAFFPLWPLMLRGFLKILPFHPVFSAMLLANLLSILAFLAVYHYVRKCWGGSLAAGTLFFLSAYPGSVFYFFPYSESLFLLLAALLFVFLRARKDAYAAAAAFFLPLTRAVGFFAIVPILYGLYCRFKSKERMRWTSVPLILAAPAGLGAYLLLMYLQTGDPLSGLAAQELFPYTMKRSLLGFVNPFTLIEQFFTVRGFHNFFYSLLDRFWFVVFLASLIKLWKWDRELFWYALPMGVYPVLTGSYMSLTRFLSVIFPMFMVIAAFFSNGRLKRWTPLALGGMISLEVLLLVRHACSRWAG